jgi:hypothetical protein
MNSFWASFFEQLKGCGRNATIFMSALAGVLGLVVLAVALHNAGLFDFLVPVLPGIGILLFAWGFRTVRRLLRLRRDRMKYPPLSCDELRVARSKLRRDGNSNNLQA